MVAIRRNARRWRTYFAFGIIIAGLVGSAVIWRLLDPPSLAVPVYQSANQAATNYIAGGRRCDPSKIAAISSAHRRSTEADYCAQAKEQDRLQQANLTQGIRSARAAEQGVSVNQAQVRVGAVQAVLLWCAFLAAVSAGEAAIRAARAADKTIGHQQWVTERELRPYVFVYEAFLSRKKKPKSPYVVADANVEKRIFTRKVYCYWKNSGSTPAKNVKIAARAAIFRNGSEIPLNEVGEFKFMGPIEPRGFLGDEIKVDGWEERHTDIRNILRRGRHEIHLWGKVMYDDEFRNDRWTTFHFYTGGDMAYDRDLNTAKTGNDYA
jgi:hypothetical protein